MIIGVTRSARSDTSDDLELQQRELATVEAKKIFHIFGTQKDTQRQLEDVLQFCREGDLLVVTSLDRLSNSTHFLCQAITLLRAKSVDVQVLDIGLDTRTPEGAAMVRIFEALAKFSTKTKYESQRDGIARARAEGRYKGRKPTARAKSPQVLHAYRMGRTVAQIVREFGIGRASVYRILHAGGLWPGPGESAGPRRGRTLPGT